MPALGYKIQFVPLVQNGLKTHSIRAFRKRRFKQGDTLMHYCGMRTKQCRKIRPDTKCLSAVVVEISAALKQVRLLGKAIYYPRGELNATWLYILAMRDGFESTDAFFAFFLKTHGPRFTGQLIEWNP